MMYSNIGLTCRETLPFKHYNSLLLFWAGTSKLTCCWPPSRVVLTSLPASWGRTRYCLYTRERYRVLTWDAVYRYSSNNCTVHLSTVIAIALLYISLLPVHKGEIQSAHLGCTVVYRYNSNTCTVYQSAAMQPIL